MLPKSIRPTLVAGSAIACLLAAMAASAQDKPNWREGRQIFKKCGTCHTFKEGKHRFGPSLYRVIGRNAGRAERFPYSNSMVSKGEAGLVWNDETLDAFLQAPKTFVPKTKMNFPGLPDPKDRRNVIAYVKRKAMR